MIFKPTGIFSCMCVNSKVSRPEKLAVHVFEVDEDVDKDEVRRLFITSSSQEGSQRSRPVFPKPFFWGPIFTNQLQAIITQYNFFTILSKTCFLLKVFFHAEHVGLVFKGSYSYQTVNKSINWNSQH